MEETQKRKEKEKLKVPGYYPRKTIRFESIHEKKKQGAREAQTKRFFFFFNKDRHREDSKRNGILPNKVKTEREKRIRKRILVDLCYVYQRLRRKRSE